MYPALSDGRLFLLAPSHKAKYAVFFQTDVCGFALSNYYYCRLHDGVSTTTRNPRTSNAVLITRVRSKWWDRMLHVSHRQSREARVSFCLWRLSSQDHSIVERAAKENLSSKLCVPLRGQSNRFGRNSRWDRPTAVSCLHVIWMHSTCRCDGRMPFAFCTCVADGRRPTLGLFKQYIHASLPAWFTHLTLLIPYVTPCLPCRRKDNTAACVAQQHRQHRSLHQWRDIQSVTFENCVEWVSLGNDNRFSARYYWPLRCN